MKKTRVAWRLSCLLAVGLAPGGCSNGSQLSLSLHLSDQVYTATSTVRLIIANKSGSFTAAPTPVQISSGLFTSNRDVDGDGQVDIVIETTKDFDLAQVTDFTIEPKGLTDEVNVSVRAETFDANQTRVARIGGASRDLSTDHVSALLSPISQTTAPGLAPTCVGTCPSPTASYGQADVAQTIQIGSAVTALASGAFDEATRVELAIGSGEAVAASTANTAAQPRAGVVQVWSSTGDALTQNVTLTGAFAGDRLGAALAAADLDGDGVTDLIVGSPGDSGNRGALWVLYGPLTGLTTLDGAATVARATGESSDSQLGASIAVEDLNGDGVPEIIVGAPGIDTVYVLKASDVPRGEQTLVLPAAMISTITGTPGTQFGAAVTARESAVAIAAPMEATGVVYYDGAANFLDAATHAIDTLGASHWAGAGGAFGTSLLLADIDGAGTLSLFVGAPLDGDGRILSRPASALVAGELDATSGVTSLRGGIDGGALGASLAAVRAGFGDEILFGASGATSAPGAAYTLPSIAPTIDTEMVIGSNGTPMSVLVNGGNDGDGFGVVSIAGDFNQDGALDLAIGASSAGTVSIVTGPVL